MKEEHALQGKGGWRPSAKKSHVQRAKKIHAGGFFDKQHLQFYKHGLLMLFSRR